MTDLEGLTFAYKAAALLGTDPSTQNGAILVQGGEIRLAAGNSFPDNVRESPERWQKPLKYSFVEHAERAVIYSAAKYGIRTAGATMYCPFFACTDCARAIIKAGIKQVVGHLLPVHKEATRWLEEIKIGDEMLYEAGIIFRRVPMPIGGASIRFMGKLITP